MFVAITKHIKNTSIDWNSIGVWTLFSIAVMRALSFINFNFYLYHFVFPGLIFFLYLGYFFFKTKVLLTYADYIKSVVLISIIYHAVVLFIKTYISLSYSEGNAFRSVVMFFASLLLASVLYFLIYSLHRIYKACLPR